MDRNEAIEHLKVVLKTCDVQDEEAVEMAIEALNCSEIPNNSDTISRQQAIDAVEKSMYENPHENEIHRGMHDHEHRHFLTILMGLPSAQPEREKGEWVYNSPVTMKCNRCGLVIKDWDWHRFKICPNCGADMRGEKDE